MAAPATREVKVGLFVFIAFVLLAVAVFSISDFYTSQAQYTYPLRMRFNFVNGIEAGAPVRVSGVQVGEVRSVRVYRDEANQQMQVEVGVRIARDAQIEEDSLAYINTLGLLGEKYVEIVPGTPGARLVNPGEILMGKDSVSTEKMMESGYRAVAELEKAVGALNAVLGDPQTQESIKGTLSNSREATEQLTLFLTQANGVMGKIARGEGTVGRLLTQDDLYQDLKDLTSDLKTHPWKLFFRPKEKKK
ncbi:MAG: MCE family protein [Candidatus Omnitrophica bacterium]|nr:MCE family protein [Candidatus Omnitrophota bacterium]